MKLQATVLAALMAAGLSLPAIAQVQQAPAPPAHSQHGDRMMRRFSNLNLSDQQKSQIHTLMQDTRKQLRGQIDAILTPDQRAQLKSDMQQRRAEHAQRNPNPVASPN